MKFNTAEAEGSDDFIENTTRRYLFRFRNLGVIRPDGKNRGTKYYLSVR